MDRRLALHEILVETLGSRFVYFKSPDATRMDYPCIIYKRTKRISRFANNRIFINKRGYMVTVIDSDPDSPIPDKVGQLPLCRFDTHFVKDGLYHDVYILHY